MDNEMNLFHLMYMRWLLEPYGHRQLITVQGDVKKYMFMIKPYRLLCNFLMHHFFFAN